MSRPFRFCPQCGLPLSTREIGGMDRRACDDASCGFVHWDNPTPVVAAIVEYEGRIVLAHNRMWPPTWYALITGFLERQEDPASAVLREVKEELDLDATVANFVGLYEFHRMNQLLIAYHVPATGRIRMNEELDDYRLVPFEECTYWSAGTGYALRDWLRGKGFDPQEHDFVRN